MEALVSRPPAQDALGTGQLQRLRDLDSTLSSIEHWVEAFFALPIPNWLAITVSMFSQFTHCLVVLFKLTILDEPGWDLAEVQRRADVFNIIDRVCSIIQPLRSTLGLVDAPGPRRSLFFKSDALFHAMRKFLQAEMAQKRSSAVPPSLESENGAGYSQGFETAAVPDEFLMSLSDEPWVSDILAFSWDFPPQEPMDVSFGS